MKIKDKCLYCYEPLPDGNDFHPKCSMQFFGTSSPPELPYSLHEMSQLAKEVVERSISVPGVQAKLSMSLVNKSKSNTDTRLTVVGALGGQYIFKPPNAKYAEMPANEHLTMRMAEACGIKVAPSSLIKLASGELAYITKRVDRTDLGEKVHMMDMFQITEAFDKYRSSMEKVGKALHSHSSNPLLDKIFLFELTLFSFLTGNNDMHLKNFSMIESTSGWILAPAYDLLNVKILLPEDTEELALTLEGKKNKLQKEHFEKFGNGLGLTKKQIEGAFKRLSKKKAQVWLEKSFLSNDMKAAYFETLAERHKRLNS